MENKQPTPVRKNDQPKTQKSLFAYFISCWTENYANFKGRARRREYWGFMLFQCLIGAILYFFGLLPDFSNLEGIMEYQLIIYVALLLVSFLPGLGVSVRRLHDTNRSGWWMLLFTPLGYIPLVNIISGIFCLIFMCKDSDAGTNQYGKNPKGL